MRTISDDVSSRRATPAAASDGSPPDGDQIVGGEGVEVSPDACRGQPEPLREGGGCDRTLLQHGTTDPVARARVLSRDGGSDFHTIIVT
jgi:hypothetical protein